MDQLGLSTLSAVQPRSISLGVLKERIHELEERNSEEVAAVKDLLGPLGCAATLAEFDLLELLGAFGVEASEANMRLLRIHAVQNTRSDSKLTLWRLTHAARRQTLAAVGSRDGLQTLRRRLFVNEPSTLQRMADLLLDGRELPSTLGIGELAALVEAHDWYVGIISELPEIELLRRRLAMGQLLEPLRRLVGTQFVGRKSELSRLADYVGILPHEGLLTSIGVAARRIVRRTIRTFSSDPPLYVVGPGGVGKSSLVARFILDHIIPDNHNSIPFVLVDFDRAQVEPALPFTLLQAALQQLRIQFPLHDAEMARMSESLGQQMRSSDAAEYVKSHSLLNAVVADFAQQVERILAENGNSEPLLWVLDTFEEAQRMGDSTVGPLWELMNTLQQYLPRLRLVVCGRVAPPGFSWDLVPLEEFDPPSALAFLQQRVAQSSANPLPDSDKLARVIALVGRSPLALRLAARLVAEEDRTLLMLKVKHARILGVLFHRVLEHIRVHKQLDATEIVEPEECARLQEELGRLVFPGLAVRRVTPGVIRWVLAKPCKIALRDEGHASRLFKALRQQVDIVEEGGDDGGGHSVFHRSDLRRMMLRDLETKAGGRMVERIMRRAVRYHKAFDTPVHRAEEVYHRLRLKQPEQTIRDRWLPEIRPYLIGALDEMESPKMRLLLASLLGVTLDGDSLKNADHEDWEFQTEQRASEYLRNGSPERAIWVMQERKERSLASPLLSLEAQAHHLIGDFDQASAFAKRAFDECAEVGDMAGSCNAVLLLALADEAVGGVERAHERTLFAQQIARQLGEQILLLRSGIALLRLSRHLGKNEDELVPLVEELNALLDTEILRELRRRPALLRELLAELAECNPKLLRIGIDALGVDLPSFEAAEDLAYTLGRWMEQVTGPELREIVHAYDIVSKSYAPARIGMESSESATPVASAAEVDSAPSAFDGPDSGDRIGHGVPTLDEWAAWLWRSGSGPTRRLLLELLRTQPPGKIVLVRLGGLYQKEVERRIGRVLAMRTL